MKKIEAYQGLDGQIYAEEMAVMEADEKFIVAGMVKELDGLCMEKKGVGTPSRVMATYRGKVKEIFGKWERMVLDVVEVEEDGIRPVSDAGRVHGSDAEG